MGFLKIPFKSERLQQENREQFSYILPPTNLLISLHLLHNSMSQELLGEALKHRNNKQEERRKLNRKVMK